ncbi:hypothetical protein PAEPH01_1261 [Pancytospora epiphaga]|nr:hypothetical protein PAEPH01_1261 [Pancytospora epiphaga]
MKTIQTCLIILIVAILKMIDLPSFLHHFNNPIHDYFLYKPPYTVIPPFTFYLLCLLSDILTAYKIRSLDYLIHSAFVPLGTSSIENFLLSYNFSFSSQLLQLLDPIYFVTSDIPFLTVSVHHVNHVPSLSGFWYHHMCMFEQFSRYSADIILLCAHILVAKEIRLVPIFKTRSTYRNYLLFIHNSPYLLLYLVIYGSFAYLSHLSGLYNIVNTNFLFWVSSLFIGVYLIEIKYCK